MKEKDYKGAELTGQTDRLVLAAHIADLQRNKIADKVVTGPVKYADDGAKETELPYLPYNKKSKLAFGAGLEVKPICANESENGEQFGCTISVRDRSLSFEESPLKITYNKFTEITPVGNDNMNLCNMHNWQNGPFPEWVLLATERCRVLYCTAAVDDMYCWYRDFPIRITRTGETFKAIRLTW